MRTATIPIRAIQVGERRRPVNPYVVENLRKSIEQSGLLQNIGVVQDGPDAYRLIFGAHRLEAVIELDWTDVPALVFPEGTSDEEGALAEIQENYTRNELTGAERKAFAAEVGRISTILREKYGKTNQSGSDCDWFSDWRAKTGLPKNTGYDWWSAFCKEAGLSITPKQASDENRQAFFAWLDEQKTREDAEKARKEAEREADKQRKEQEKFNTARDNALKTILGTLLFLTSEYGVDAVMASVIDPYLVQAKTIREE